MAFRVAIECNDNSQQTVLHYFVQRPLFHSRRPIGRSTHVYVALDMQSDLLVCIKDTWRVLSDGVLSEKEVPRGTSPLYPSLRRRGKLSP